MKIYIENDPLFYPEIKYIFSIFCANKGIQYGLVDSKSDADFIISDHEYSDIRISREFYQKLQEGKFDFKYHFTTECHIKDSSGIIDYLSSAFYILGCIQEINNKSEDEFGRFKYSDSFQNKFGNVKDNIVQTIFDELFNLNDKLNVNQQPKYKSRIFLSHDIDTIYGSILQDSLFNIKKLRPDLVLKVMLFNLFSNPTWLNIDRIMKIESEYNFYSTFFWLVNRGKVSDILSNSDYDINNKQVRFHINKIHQSKWENGLHKSATNDTFSTEIKKLDIDIKGNRYHYLKFKPHTDFQKIDEAGLLFDSSLGFADESGFRNGYGQPYHPYNMEERRPYKFVECPLNIMDTTFFNYKKASASEFVDFVISFCEKNNFNNTISVLFHNNYISDYKFKTYGEAFKRILSYFYDSGLKCITQTEIINQFKNEYSNKIDE